MLLGFLLIVVSFIVALPEFVGRQRFPYRWSIPLAVLVLALFAALALVALVNDPS